MCAFGAVPFVTKKIYIEILDKTLVAEIVTKNFRVCIISNFLYDACL